MQEARERIKRRRYKGENEFIQIEKYLVYRKISQAMFQFLLPSLHKDKGADTFVRIAK